MVISTTPETKPDDKAGTADPVCPFCCDKLVEGKIWLHAEASTVKVQGYLYWSAGKDQPSEHWKVDGKSTLLKADGFINAYPSRQAYQCEKCQTVPVLLPRIVPAPCATCLGSRTIQVKGILWGTNTEPCPACNGTGRG
jgi:hypothetical protein